MAQTRTTNLRNFSDKLGLVAGKHAALRDDYERITQEMYAKNLTLAQTNRTLSLLRSIDLIILEAEGSLSEISTEISRSIVEVSPYATVAILSQNKHNDQFINFQGWDLSTIRAQKVLRINALEKLNRVKLPLDGSWLSSPEKNLMIDLANPQGTPNVDTMPADMKEVFKMLHEQLDVRSLYFTKLRARETLVGVILVGLEEPMPRIDDIELIERLGEAVGIALDNKLLYEENRLVLSQLKENNEKLKALDEAKDEFVSMASHQLRTPLTSMKGYVSMVLEGDTGEITDIQRSMLKQAFDSSQRMVYLISDLLNVSRLRTGKFTITDSPTYLPDVIEGEVKQLTETATARKLKITFDKPDNFPTLKLDETKIRQVVMNFLDNAIYYTPAGGTITVRLIATDKSVEYTVTDTGLGVPEEDRKHLFSKFYRAQNARTMRPDGTGLGLFMAQKIIIAQGGSIVFSSTEGKGSTFGFNFPLAKVFVVTPPNQVGASDGPEAEKPTTAEETTPVTTPASKIVLASATAAKQESASSKPIEVKESATSV